MENHGKVMEKIMELCFRFPLGTLQYDHLLTQFLYNISEEFLLEDINNYRYLTYGHIPVAGVDDATEFRLTIEAMNIMGFSPEDQSGNTSVFQRQNHYNNSFLASSNF